jgi:3-dehydroquinate synthase
MQSIKVDLGKRSYNIVIGKNILKHLPKYIHSLDLGCDAYIITNGFLKRTYGGLLQNSLIRSKISVRFKLIPDTEKSKSFEMASQLLRDLSRYDKNKRIFIVGLGGGVVGDLAGFLASIYKRGIPYIQVPTTLLAQVDSSIGGKTGVDLKEGKNLSGTFYQPRLVLSDIILLDSLDARQIKTGLAEVIKYGIIKDKQLFGYLKKNFKKILARNQKALVFIVKRCSAIKANIVAKDETEVLGLRTILNFGHTIGHAIEAAARFQGYNHGEAVSLGMLAAVGISKKLNLLSDLTAKEIERLIKSVGLPTKIKKIEISRILDAYYHDKKFKGARNRFVLITGIGKTRIVENIPISVIKEVLKERI